MRQKLTTPASRFGTQTLFSPCTVRAPILMREGQPFGGSQCAGARTFVHSAQTPASGVDMPRERRRYRIAGNQCSWWILDISGSSPLRTFLKVNIQGHTLRLRCVPLAPSERHAGDANTVAVMPRDH